jgi:hypothetical protein
MEVQIYFLLKFHYTQSIPKFLSKVVSVTIMPLSIKRNQSLFTTLFCCIDFSLNILIYVIKYITKYCSEKRLISFDI